METDASDTQTEAESDIEQPTEAASEAPKDAYYLRDSRVKSGAYRERRKPKKFCPELCQKIIGSLCAGNFTSVAFRYAGITEPTFKKWMALGKADAELVEATPETEYSEYARFYLDVQQAVAQAEVGLVSKMYARANGQAYKDDAKLPAGDQKSSEFILSRRFSKRWGNNGTSKIEHTGIKRGPIKIDLSDAEVEKELRLALEDIETMRTSESDGPGDPGEPTKTD